MYRVEGLYIFWTFPPSSTDLLLTKSLYALVLCSALDLTIKRGFRAHRISHSPPYAILLRSCIFFQGRAHTAGQCFYTLQKHGECPKASLMLKSEGLSCLNIQTAQICFSYFRRKIVIYWLKKLAFPTDISFFILRVLHVGVQSKQANKSKPQRKPIRIRVTARQNLPIIYIYPVTVWNIKAGLEIGHRWSVHSL